MKTFNGFALLLFGSEALSGMRLQRIGMRNFHGSQSPMDLALKMSPDNDEGSRRRKRDALIDLWNRVKPKKNDEKVLDEKQKGKIELSDAQSLKLQAERIRLEAERMDAELTLAKIAKLEEGLIQAKAKGKPVEDMQVQLKNLQVKLQGITSSSAAASGTKTESQVVDVQENKTPPESLENASSLTSDTPPEKVLDRTISVDFMERVISNAIESDSSLNINSSDIAKKLSNIKSQDISRDPSYSQEDITEKVRKIKKEIENDPYQKQILDLVDGNLTQLALFSLELEEYVQSNTNSDLNTIISKEPKPNELFSLDSTVQTSLDRSIESLYPKCMRRDGLKEPTVLHVQSLLANVLPKAKFTRTSNAEKVLGGYVIKGRHTWDNGEDLINAIDAELAKANLADKMTVLYSPDFTVYANLDDDGAELDLYAGEQPSPILYVTAPEYCPDRNRVALTLTSALGLATSWYLSVYPFLLNPLIASRVEEQLSLADASMTYDLDWLTQLSTPLFLTFIGIQVTHEVAHSLVAAKYGMEITFPTFVPSLITGTTSSVTTFKKPPKTKTAMFDFAVAGPLAGMVSSMIAIGIGSQLTMTSDPSTLPSLPIEILRQSSLGGGIIDSFITGALNVPNGATTTGILVSLHPIAVAGYISLVVNALSVLPIGTTDGGRIAMTMFGRPAKLVVGNLFMASLLFIGFAGSDLFLFYFAFVIAFQTGNEIACRDETSEIPTWRGAVAVAAYCLSFLSLVPIQ